MENKLSQIIIEGTLFYVAIKEGAFIQATKPGNKIGFSDLKEEHPYYTALYDLNAKNVVTILTEAEEVAEVKRVFIPEQIISSGIAYDKPFAEQFNEESYKGEFGVLLIDEVIEKRLMGILPVIDIAGDPFIVDWQLHELRHYTDLIRFDKLAVNSENGTYYSFYHVPSRQLVEIDRNITEYPKGMVFVEIPNELVLDPVAVARQRGFEETELLMDYPLRSHLKANITPLSETPLAELIQENKKTAKLENKEHQQKPKHRTGKRIR